MSDRGSVAVSPLLASTSAGSTSLGVLATSSIVPPSRKLPGKSGRQVLDAIACKNLPTAGLRCPPQFPHGEVSERSKERDWKSRTCCKVRRGFKSRPLRLFARAGPDGNSRPGRFGLLRFLAEEEDRAHHPDEEEDGHEDVTAEPPPWEVGPGAREENRRA